MIIFAPKKQLFEGDQFKRARQHEKWFLNLAEEGIWKFNFASIEYLTSIKYLASVNSEERENPPDAFDSPVAYL